MNYTLLGKRIKEKRTAYSLTQEQLAEKVGISTNFLACIEIGKKHGSFETYVKIANILDVTIDSLIYEPKEENTKLEKQLIEVFNKAEKYEKNLIINIAKTVIDTDKHY